MKNFGSIPMRRLFLPPVVQLQANDSDDSAAIVTVPDTGLAHASALGAYQTLDFGFRPTIHFDVVAAISSAERPDAEREVQALQEVGYYSYRSTDRMVRRHEPSEARADLLGMLELGHGLDDAAWKLVGSEPRRFAWSAEALTEDGAWARRCASGAQHADQLRAELRPAFERARCASVHLTPELDGSLRVRLQGSPRAEDAVTWEDQVGGCGLMVIQCHASMLLVYRPCDDWLSWHLERRLLEAWAGETLGEDASWHWG